MKKKIYVKIIQYWKKIGRPSNWNNMIFNMTMYVISH